jgi:hypothetical protein
MQQTMNETKRKKNTKAKTTKESSAVKKKNEPKGHKRKQRLGKTREDRRRQAWGTRHTWDGTAVAWKLKGK